MVKGKRWKKGQSSSSNPSTHKHREMAKNNRNFFNFGQPSQNTKSQLTSQALAQLNASNNENSLDMKSLISDSESIGRDSFASHWSDCTNATFNRVHKYWRSNSAMHKEILAVLAAVTEVIKENSGEGTEVEYFAALMTGLEPVKENEETAAAFLYLISLAIRKVPESVLKVKFDELLKVFMDILEKHGENVNNYVLIKSCLICLCCLLKCQERKAWQSNEAVTAYKKILSFVNDSKPKIRKFSHQAISLILNGCSQKTTNDVYIQVSGLTADYCVKLMMGQSSSDEEGKETDYLKGILHMLSLLKHIARHFEGEHLKMICENLLRLITLKDLIVTESCFHVFYQLFNSKTNQLTANFNAKLINALYDYQPSEQSGPQMIVWLAVMDSAIRSLNRLNKQLCLSHLPHLVQRYMQAFCSSHAKVHFAAAKCLNAALEQCIRADIDVLVEDLNSSSEMSKSTLHKIFTHLETGLSYQYHNAWPHIIKIIGTAFTCFGHPSTFVVVAKCLHSLANLRESEQFDYIREADSAISRAIKTYGPKLVIDCIRLDITGDESSYEYPRSWMLPLLKENIKRTELSYFVKELMPLAKKLRAKAEFFGSQGQPIQAKIFENLQNQFWSLLPGFCNFPTDFADSFGHLAKTLGETLEKCTDLRCHVLKALRTLILSNTDENKAIVSKYAKNYLPIMFNLYTTDAKQDDSIGQAILDTTKLFLKITPLDLVNTYLQQAMKNYAVYSQKHTEWLTTSKQDDEIQEAPSAQKRVVFDFKKTDRDPPAKTNTEELQPFLFAKLRFLDLIAVLAKFSNRANIDSVYQLAIEGITSKQSDKTVQKKSYKILDSILESGQPELNEAKNEAIFAYIVEEKFESIAKSLVGSLNDCASAAKVPRVKCLNALMAYVTNAKQKPLIRQILPEVILSVREVNQKSRDSSLALLNSMLRLWQKLGAEATPPLNEADSLDEFVRLVMVSLAGSINMVSCGCLALSSLSYEFKENLSGSIIKDLVEASCHLVRKSEHKEVIVSGLNLLKVLCSIFQSTTLGQYLDCICDTIHSLHEKRLSSSPVAAAATATQTPETSAVTAPPVTKSQRIKQFVKLILKKLMKKFTSELITQKLFANEAPTGANSMETAVPGAKPALTAAIRHGLENLIANLKKAIDKERARKTEEQLDAKKNKGAAIDVISLYTAAAPDNEDASKSVVLNEIGDLLKESDSESEAEDGKSRKTSKSSREEKREKRREGKAKSSGKAWLQDNDEDNPLDLLDPMAIKSVLASRPKSKQDQEKKTKNGGFKMNASGKLVIEDDESSDSSDDDMKSKTSRKSKAKGKKNDDDLEEMMDTLSITKKSAHSAKQKKRKMDDDSDEDNDDTKSKFTYRSGGTGIHRKLNTNTDTNSKKKNVDYGSEYKPKKAAGDMKVKNKPDPYAYIPFNPLKLNKRKRAKFSGEFKGVVKAGKPNKQNEKTKRNN